MVRGPRRSQLGEVEALMTTYKELGVEPADRRRIMVQRVVDA
jgi:hypothetical protein